MMTDPYGIFGIFKAQPMQPEHAEWLVACRKLAEKGDMDAITALYTVTDLPEAELRRYLAPLEKKAASATRMCCPARFHQSGLAEGKSRQRYRDPEAIPEKRQTGLSGTDRGTGPFLTAALPEPARTAGYGDDVLFNPFPGCGQGHVAMLFLGGIDEAMHRHRPKARRNCAPGGSGNPAGGPLAGMKEKTGEGKAPSCSLCSSRPGNWAAINACAWYAQLISETQPRRTGAAQGGP